MTDSQVDNKKVQLLLGKADRTTVSKSQQMQMVSLLPLFERNIEHGSANDA